MIDKKLLESIDKTSERIVEDLIRIRRDLHQIPELGSDLPKTREYILKELRKLDVEINENVGENGIVATLYGGHKGQTIAYRADMDALPLNEENVFDFSSRHDGKMHACGHDGHVTITLGILNILVDIKNDIKGNIKFIFQPAEETTGGALNMINDGVLKNPDVDYILGCHIWPSIESGKIGLRKGPIMAGTDIVDITIEGKGGHGAIPYKTVNPIVVGSKIINEIEGIKNYFIPSSQNSVISFGAFNAGETNNVIPQTARLLGSVRTFSKETQSIYISKLTDIIKSVETVYGAKCELKYIKNYPPTINDEQVVDNIENTLIEYGLQDKIIHIDEPSMGAEDFSYFLQNVPGAYIFIGSRNEEKGIMQEIHHPNYDMDEAIFETIPAILSKTLLSFLMF
ncbi:MAG: Amidohydrolase [Clostridiales bacterium 38_11]|nr:MAG: Amidohydrolase [Clostridiales bacterium 38_11]HBH11659.1 amidohydrolase [Clostridiales bacterium]